MRPSTIALLLSFNQRRRQQQMRPGLAFVFLSSFVLFYSTGALSMLLVHIVCTTRLPILVSHIYRLNYPFLCYVCTLHVHTFPQSSLCKSIRFGSTSQSCFPHRRSSSSHRARRQPAGSAPTILAKSIFDLGRYIWARGTWAMVHAKLVGEILTRFSRLEGLNLHTMKHRVVWCSESASDSFGRRLTHRCHRYFLSQIAYFVSFYNAYVDSTEPFIASALFPQYTRNL